MSIDLPAGFKGSITLSASSNTGWPVSVEPRTVNGEGSYSATFFVSVTAPAAEPAGFAGSVAVEATGSVAGVPCSNQATASAPVSVLPYLEVFNGQIPPDSVRVNGEIGRATFDIDLEVLSNTEVDASFEFTAEPGILVEAPMRISMGASGSVPSSGNVSVLLRAPGLGPGAHDVSIVVRASAENLRTHVGLLGLTIYVPRGSSEPVPVGVAVAALLGLAAAVGLGWWWHRTKVAQRTLARLERLRPPK